MSKTLLRRVGAIATAIMGAAALLVPYLTGRWWTALIFAVFALAAIAFVVVNWHDDPAPVAAPVPHTPSNTFDLSGISSITGDKLTSTADNLVRSRDKLTYDVDETVHEPKQD